MGGAGSEPDLANRLQKLEEMLEEIQNNGTERKTSSVRKSTSTGQPLGQVDSAARRIESMLSAQDVEVILGTVSGSA